MFRNRNPYNKALKVLGKGMKDIEKGLPLLESRAKLGSNTFTPLRERGEKLERVVEALLKYAEEKGLDKSEGEGFKSLVEKLKELAFSELGMEKKREEIEGMLEILDKLEEKLREPLKAMAEEVLLEKWRKEIEGKVEVGEVEEELSLILKAVLDGKEAEDAILSPIPIISALDEALRKSVKSLEETPYRIEEEVRKSSLGVGGTVLGGIGLCLSIALRSHLGSISHALSVLSGLIFLAGVFGSLKANSELTEIGEKGIEQVEVKRAVEELRAAIHNG